MYAIPTRTNSFVLFGVVLSVRPCINIQTIYTTVRTNLIAFFITPTFLSVLPAMYYLDIPNRHLCQKVPPLNAEEWQVDYQKDFLQWLVSFDVQMKHRILCNPIWINGYRVML
jgi:hypothetical protein